MEGLGRMDSTHLPQHTLHCSDFAIVLMVLMVLMALMVVAIVAAVAPAAVAAVAAPAAVAAAAAAAAAAVAAAVAAAFVAAAAAAAVTVHVVALVAASPVHVADFAAPAAVFSAMQLDVFSPMPVVCALSLLEVSFADFLYSLLHSFLFLPFRSFDAVVPPQANDRTQFWCL